MEGMNSLADAATRRRNSAVHESDQDSEEESESEEAETHQKTTSFPYTQESDPGTASRARAAPPSANSMASKMSKASVESVTVSWEKPKELELLGPADKPKS